MHISRKAAAVAAAFSLWAASPAFADIKDYEFQLVQNEAKKGEAAPKWREERIVRARQYMRSLVRILTARFSFRS